MAISSLPPRDPLAPFSDGATRFRIKLNAPSRDPEQDFSNMAAGKGDVFPQPARFVLITARTNPLSVPLSNRSSREDIGSTKPAYSHVLGRIVSGVTGQPLSPVQQRFLDAQNSLAQPLEKRAAGQASSTIAEHGSQIDFLQSNKPPALRIIIRRQSDSAAPETKRRADPPLSTIAEHGSEAGFQQDGQPLTAVQASYIEAQKDLAASVKRQKSGPVLSVAAEHGSEADFEPRTRTLGSVQWRYERTQNRLAARAPAWTARRTLSTFAALGGEPGFNNVQGILSQGDSARSGNDGRRVTFDTKAKPPA